ncbi:MAG: chemotaxis protein CheX [Deltaproteobacteria bacterium]|nr:chemotaxis protein CheX [Deltaproteobacteria bacterium]
MKAEHVNAFLAPSVEVLRKMARTAVAVGRVSRLQRTLAPNALSIIIGLNGSLSGSVILTAGREVAWALAGRIVREELSEEAEGEVMAVLSELANTIVGNATGHLYELGHTEGITPPTVVMGARVSFDFSEGVESVLIPLETDAGEIDLIVSLARPFPGAAELCGPRGR